MSNFQYPNINGKTSEEKIGQIVSFLRQLVDQLNFEGADGQTSHALQEMGDKITDIQKNLGMKTT